MAELTSLSGAPLQSEKKRTVTLEYDLRNQRLNIGGELENLDLAINMLEQAARYLKNQQLLGQFVQVQQNERIMSRITQQ